MAKFEEVLPINEAQATALEKKVRARDSNDRIEISAGIVMAMLKRIYIDHEKD